MRDAITLRGVGKRFVFSRRNRRPLYRELLHLFGGSGAPRAVDALRDLDLTCPVGGRIGIVGPNGAGKSTLLRIIAGIYRPSSGERRVEGRVACFFESGAMMAPTLAVVDNIHLYGAIVGLSRAETRASVEEILAFAELTEQSQTRLEHLSWGTQQRLFVAVMMQAIRLRKAEIFLFDEWLVGADVRFKDKSARALAALPSPEQTIIYASHDLPRLEHTCEHAIYLRDGRVRMFDRTAAVLAAYVADSKNGTKGDGPER